MKSNRNACFVLLALVLIGSLAQPVTSQEATPAAGGVTILGPDESYAGVTRAEWDARWWQWTVSLPADSNPGVNFEGVDCGAGQSGPVFFVPANFTPVAASVSCTVPAGTAILVGLGGAECSTVEPPPFFGRNEQELRECAISANDGVTNVTATINGEDVPGLMDYRSTTPLFTMDFPADNIFDVPEGVALSVADGYSMIIAPPPPGEYEIVVSNTFGEFTSSGTALVTVEEARVIDPEASPVAPEPEASPVADGGLRDFAPAPEECTAEPLSADALALLATPVAEVATPAPATGTGPFAVPEGQPADPETAAAVSAVIRGAWACLNANDWSRFLAYQTTEEIRQSFPVDDIAFLISQPPVPLPIEEQTAIYAILGVEVLEDGRVGAFVIVDTAGDPLPVEINYQIAVNTGDGWLLDDFICFAGDGTLC